MQNLVSVTSSNIRSIAYDEHGPTLSVTFIGKGGKPDSTYEYADFPPEKWQEFLNSPSKGGFFFSSVKGKYVATKVS